MVKAEELRDLIAAHPEWLLVRETGRTFPLFAGEIDVSAEGDKVHFGFIDDKGLHTWRLNAFARESGELSIDAAGAFAKKREVMRLVPRISAAELAAVVEAARLQKANEIAQLIADSFPGIKLGRVSLNIENGRIAQIQFETEVRRPTAAMFDITGTLTPEALFTGAILWLEKLGLRKNKPVNDLWLICEKRHARNAQKLHALLTDRWQRQLTVMEIDRKQDPPRMRELPTRKIRDLWREKAPRLTLPPAGELSDTARRIIDLAPNEIDIIFSRQGETIRFMGLPFARVRSVAAAERAWFGIGRDRRILIDESWDELKMLVDELAMNRSAIAPNKRHEYYRAAPEAWLESILRRNIRLLDANLILSPLYNQFRSSNDKIDLLALRRDGRLVIIELKTKQDRDIIFQAADYWRKIELQRRRGILAAADLFEDREILDKPALVYLAAPAWSFHRNFDHFARCVSPEIELWRFELHERWREQVKVLARHDYAGADGSFTNR